MQRNINCTMNGMLRTQSFKAIKVVSALALSLLMSACAQSARPALNGNAGANGAQGMAGQQGQQGLQGPTGPAGSNGAGAASQGTVDGGGGKGVVCTGKDGKKHVQLLDLWEAENRFGRVIPEVKGDLDAQIRAKVRALRDIVAYPYDATYDGKPVSNDENFLQQVELYAIRFGKDIDKIEQAKHGVTLTPTNDSFEDVHPSDCSVEQIVRYVDGTPGAGGDTIFVNLDLVDGVDGQIAPMDETNRVALAVHEGFYRVVREFGEKTSKRVRRAVGLVMEGKTQFTPLADWLKSPHLTCTGFIPYDNRPGDHDTIVHMVEKNGSVYWVPEKVDGVLMMGLGAVLAFRDTSLTEEKKEILTEGAGGPMVLGDMLIDFDTEIMVNFGPRPTFQLIQSASGSTSAEVTTDCK